MNTRMKSNRLTKIFRLFISSLSLIPSSRYQHSSETFCKIGNGHFGRNALSILLDFSQIGVYGSTEDWYETRRVKRDLFRMTWYYLLFSRKREWCYWRLWNDIKVEVDNGCFEPISLPVGCRPLEDDSRTLVYEAILSHLNLEWLDLKCRFSWSRTLLLSCSRLTNL